MEHQSHPLLWLKVWKAPCYLRESRVSLDRCSTHLKDATNLALKVVHIEDIK